MSLYYLNSQGATHNMSANITTKFIEVITVTDAMIIMKTKSRLADNLCVHRNTVANYVALGGDQLLSVLRDGPTIVGFELINK